MQFRLSLTTLYFITISFCTLIYFAIPIGGFAVPVYFFVINLFLIIYICTYPKKFQNTILYFLKSKQGNMFLATIITIFFGLILSVFEGTLIFSKIFTNFLGEFVCSIIFPFLITILVVPTQIINKKIYKFLACFYLVIFILGIINFIGMLFDVTLIKSFFDFLINRWSIVSGIAHDSDFFNGIPRMESIFIEPSPFAYFILISSPIIYYLSSIKEKFFQSYYIDFFIKKSIFVLMFVCIIATQSPIFLVFFSIVITCYLISHIFILKKGLRISLHKIFCLKCIFIMLAIILFCGLTCLLIPNLINRINKSTTYLSRIVKTIENINNFQGLILEEGSLASRITNNIVYYKTFSQYPFFGVGYGNINSVWAKNMLSLHIPISKSAYEAAIGGKQVGGGGVFLSKFLAETGLMTTLFMYLFLFNLLRKLSYTRLVFNNSEMKLFSALRYSLIIFILTSWYDSLFILPINFFYIGILQAFFILYKQRVQIYKYKTITTSIQKKEI